MTTQSKRSAGVPADTSIATLAVSSVQDSMTPQNGDLFVPDDLEDVSRAGKLAESDLRALRAVASWIEAFVAKPHKDLGRAGPVCPFVPRAWDQNTLWLAAERVAGRTLLDIVHLISVYQNRLLDAFPVDGDEAIYKSIVVVFSDLSTDRAKGLFDSLLQQIGVASYKEAGLVLGAFYETNDGSAVYNVSFRPFAGPVPFLLIRYAVVSDWKFFLDNDERLALWARRHGESAVLALAQELRRLPWREQHNQLAYTQPGSCGDRSPAIR
jgi:hypothetical protein